MTFVYNDDYELIQPSNIEIVDPFTINITFDSEITGHAVMVESELSDFMYDDDYPEPVGMTLRINIPERNREDMREGQMTPPQATRMSEEAKRGYDNLKPLPSGAGGGTKNDY